MWGAISGERRVCHLQMLLVLASAVILLPQIGDSPNLKGQVPVFIFSRNRVIQ
jgi:hypothetical protein